MTAFRLQHVTEEKGTITTNCLQTDLSNIYVHSTQPA